MSTAIIITLCVLLLLAYLFDISSSKTKIPSVILLLILGWGVKQGADLIGQPIPDLSPVLPILGTIGLILIVLEGSLELEINASKKMVIGKSSIIAIVQMLLISFGLAFCFHYIGGTTLMKGLINAVPIAVISSAIAIPSARNLAKGNREFVTYESSLSDIFGVIFFNMITTHDTFDTAVLGSFFIQLLVMMVVSFVATLGLTFLLGKIKHHVKFTPIILLIVLIYSISKEYHLPSLIFILIMGLFIGNMNLFSQHKLVTKFNVEALRVEVVKFKEILGETTFMIRSLFFLLFGFLIQTSELLNLQTLVWAVLITVGFYVVRALLLWLFKLPKSPLLALAPRGLITILLFLSMSENQHLEVASKSLVLQVIILSNIILSVGLIRHKQSTN